MQIIIIGSEGLISFNLCSFSCVPVVLAVSTWAKLRVEVRQIIQAQNMTEKEVTWQSYSTLTK